MSIRIATIMAVVTLMAPAVGAAHSEPCGNWWQTIPAGASDGESYPAYVTVDERLPNDWLLNVWVYAESNGVDGLQRHDDACFDVDSNGRAFDDDSRDTLVF